MKGGYTALPNELLDRMDEFTPAEFKVMVAIYRLIAGYERERQQGSRQISIADIERMTKLSRQGVVNTFERICESGFVVKETEDRVTTWHIPACFLVVNSVDYQGEEVNCVDQDSQLSRPEVVNSVDQDSQLSLPEVVNSVDYIQINTNKPNKEGEGERARGEPVRV